MVTASTLREAARRLPVGAEIQPHGGTHFRVWAPRRQKVEVVCYQSHSAQPESVELTSEDGGYFTGFVESANAGTRYGFRLDDDPQVYPDPASRSQPEGPHKLSAVVDPTQYEWRDAGWRGCTLKGQVIYELHIGTFTPEGTWQAAIEQLPRLAELGITVIEAMPAADFTGNFGWGYDGVNIYAPNRLYGTPDDFRRFVDAAHQSGLGVILDVVYNHFGPTGNYIGQFSTDYITKRHHTDWGDAINYDGANSGPVREFFISNAGYWIDEFHLDGLRVDAVQAVFDESAEHILAAIGVRVRDAAKGRETLIVVENEFQETRLLRHFNDSGCGLDAAWNDDFHHAARVAATGCADYYYGDYAGTPQELISAVRWGHLYQGQWNARQGRRRGSPTVDLFAGCFVNFLQNHDQVGNSPWGRRLHELTSPGRLRALTALLLLSPGTPLLFQGQEFQASTPFHYFADHEADIGPLVRAGREQDLRKFRNLRGPDCDGQFIDPCSRQAFEESKLDLREADERPQVVALHCDLLRLRREDPVFAAQAAERIVGAVLAPEAFALRYFGDNDDDRLVIINLGRDLTWRPSAEPLLAPPAGKDWRVLWSSEDPKYGGLGSGIWDAVNSYFHGHAATVLSPAER